MVPQASPERSRRSKEVSGRPLSRFKRGAFGEVWCLLIAVPDGVSGVNGSVYDSSRVISHTVLIEALWLEFPIDVSVGLNHRMLES